MGMGTDAPANACALLDELGATYERDTPLGPLTWYGVGGVARTLAHPANTEQLAALVERCAAASIPVHVLGKGANLLVPEGVVEGIVIVLDAPPFRTFAIDATRIIAGGGADLERIITASVRAGLAGLEGLAGIPASVGGAVRMNAGGAYGEIGPYVESVTAIEPDGRIVTLDRAQLQFTYRHSNIGERFIAAATFALSPTDDQPALREKLKSVMAYKKNSQPMAASSAGCAFKNPKKVSPKGAGQLIDEAGLKGLRVGGAEVSNVHANFIVLHPGGAASDVLSVMDEVQKRVAAHHGIALEREVVVWPTNEGAA